MTDWEIYAREEGYSNENNAYVHNTILGAIANALVRIAIAMEKEEDKTDALDSGPRDTEK